MEQSGDFPISSYGNKHFWHDTIPFLFPFAKCLECREASRLAARSPDEDDVEHDVCCRASGESLQQYCLRGKKAEVIGLIPALAAIWFNFQLDHSLCG